MKYRTASTSSLIVFAAILTIALSAFGAQNGKEIYAFKSGADGYVPLASPILDSAGNLYGTTEVGGTAQDGTVYELVLNGGGTYTEKLLFTFTGNSTGFYPSGSLIFDGAGNLYGTTSDGGANGIGAVYELSPGSNGQWAESIVHSFAGGSDGFSPYGGLIIDSAGNLYGATVAGGGSANCQFGCGVVYQLTLGSNGQWTEAILYTFMGGDDGANPEYGNLIFDAAGNLYGTAANAGADGFGTIYKLTKGSNGTWVQSVLYAFTGGGDENPQFGLTFDSSGNLYGTTLGTVFELSPQSNGQWTENTLVAFDGSHGSAPYTPLTFDGQGRLWGTTERGGHAYGTIFRLTPEAGGSWKFNLMYSFPNNGSNQWEPFGGLTYEPATNRFFGTTRGGGANRAGDVFEFNPL